MRVMVKRWGNGASVRMPAAVMAGPAELAEVRAKLKALTG